MSAGLSRRALLAWPCAGLVGCASWSDTRARRVDLQGHRFARGLAPENTLEGLALALDLGVTTLELDVVVSADGVLMVNHDRHLNPDITRDAQGRYLTVPAPPVNALSVAQLQSYDVGRLRPGSLYASEFAQQRPHDGARMPRLSNVLAQVNARRDPRIRLAIELKCSPLQPDLTPAPEPFAAQLLQVLADHGLTDRAQVLSFDWRALQAVQRLRPGTPTVYLSAQTLEQALRPAAQVPDSPWTAGFQRRTHGGLPRMVAAAGGSHWSAHWRGLDAAQVGEAQALGLRVLAWTVNRAEDMRQMLDLGVDGVVTDRPDIAMVVWRERGLLW